MLKKSEKSVVLLLQQDQPYETEKNWKLNLHRTTTHEESICTHVLESGNDLHIYRFHSCEVL